jgi:hypothetical protein
VFGFVRVFVFASACLQVRAAKGPGMMMTSWCFSSMDRCNRFCFSVLVISGDDDVDGHGDGDYGGESDSGGGCDCWKDSGQNM